jgi:hypothetical protein
MEAGVGLSGVVTELYFIDARGQLLDDAVNATTESISKSSIRRPTLIVLKQVASLGKSSPFEDDPGASDDCPLGSLRAFEV